MFFLFLARLLLNYTNKFAFRMIGIRLSSAIRLHYLSALLSQNIHVLDSMPSGLATSTITSSSNTLQLGISEKLGVLVEYNATLISALIIAFTKSWVLSLVTSSAILFIMLTLGTLLPFIIAGHGRFALVGHAKPLFYSGVGTLIFLHSLKQNHQRLPANLWQVLE